MHWSNDLAFWVSDFHVELRSTPTTSLVFYRHYFIIGLSRIFLSTGNNNDLSINHVDMAPGEIEAYMDFGEYHVTAVIPLLIYQLLRGSLLKN